MARLLEKVGKILPNNTPADVYEASKRIAESSPDPNRSARVLALGSRALVNPDGVIKPYDAQEAQNRAGLGLPFPEPKPMKESSDHVDIPVQQLQDNQAPIHIPVTRV